MIFLSKIKFICFMLQRYPFSEFFTRLKFPTKFSGNPYFTEYLLVTHFPFSLAHFVYFFSLLPQAVALIAYLNLCC